MDADEIAQRYAQIELDNLKKNRKRTDPSMWPSIDSRIAELENRLANPPQKEKIKLQPIPKIDGSVS